MNEKKRSQAERIQSYARLIEKQSGRAVRPYRADGYMNMVTRYGTSKDSHEHYQFVQEPAVPDDMLSNLYEGNGLFAKIIDAPAEEAFKKGFTLKDISDQKLENFYQEALDELDWIEQGMTALKWMRLFGGSIIVMLINDGGGLEDPLNWKNIKSIDDLRVYDRSVITPDYSTMFSYDARDPFRTRGSRLGMPEFYHINSRFGTFTVHESRCLVFQNGVLPENSSNSVYQLWGMPEYIRLKKALRDTELAHSSAPRMLDRSVQPVYKMKELSSLLATEEGEDMVLKRMQVIDLARGLLNSLVIDSEGEDYDFKSFQFNGVAEVIDTCCNFLSALTNIPQTILFGRSPAGMNSTGYSDLENWYSFVGRIQSRTVKSNLRYLLSVIFQAGVATGEVDEVPRIKVEFNPLWTMSDTEQADLDLKRAQIDQTKAATIQTYVSLQAIDPTEVRRKLADSGEFSIDTILDEFEDEEDLLDAYVDQEVAPGVNGRIAETGDFDQYATGVDVDAHRVDPGKPGSAPANAPDATKLPQDMNPEEKAIVHKEDQEACSKQDLVSQEWYSAHADDAPFGVGVLVVRDGKILCGTRHNDTGYGLICGPGGHGEKGETPEQSAFRETEEEFGISPKELIPIGIGPFEPESGLRSHIFLCTDFEGEPYCLDLEMTNPKFRSLEELNDLEASLFPPFKDSLDILTSCFGNDCRSDNKDGGEGSGNWGHTGREGERGGSAPGGGNSYRVKDKNGKYVGRFSLKESKPRDYGSGKTSLGEELSMTINASYRDDFSEMAKERGYVSDVRDIRQFDKSQVKTKAFAAYGLDEKKIQRREVPRGPGEVVKNAGKYLTKEAKALAKEYDETPATYVDVRYAVMIMEDTGLDSANAVATASALDAWKGYIGNNKTFTRMRAEPDTEASKLVEQYIARSPKTTETIYRGIKVDNPDEAKKLVERFRSGEPFSQNGLSSWSASREVADGFANGATVGDENPGTKIVFINKAPKNAASIAHLSAWSEEKEVAVSGFSRFRATKVRKTKDGVYEVEVDEY